MKIYTEGLIERNGIFFSTKEEEISYPKEGNASCFEIEEDSFWFQHRNHCIVDVVKTYFPKGLFFDIGGGNGFVAKELQDNGIQTCLVEPGIAGCLNAKARGLTNVICSTLENAQFKTDSIAAVGLFDVLEHIEKDVKFLCKINIFSQMGGGGFL